MQTLIIKNTDRCNFCCSFCSAKALNIKHHDRLPDKIRDYILQVKPKEIIVVGGDPLLVSPEYYYDLINLTNSISITTNLKDFYNNSNKWKDLFSLKNFHITTSFQYGGERKDVEGEFTEYRFLQYFNKVLDETGKRVPFISVIGKNNESKALDHVRLAKSLHTVCRLNNVLPIGLSKEYYPRHKILNIYLDVEELGLGNYELNVLNKNKSCCPIYTNNCGEELGSCWVDNSDNLVTGLCDDYVGLCSQDLKYTDQPLKKCLCCPLFSLCNNCKTNRYCIKKYADENYCREMKKVAIRMKNNNWRLEL